MKRREFITLLGGASVMLPLTARAQQSAKIWRMGFIAHGHESFYDELFEGLRDYGYVEGQNLTVERRFARGNAALFKDFAAEMVRLHVDVLVVVTTPAPSSRTCSFSAQLAAISMPPSSWFFAPSGLITWPQSTTHQR